MTAFRFKSNLKKILKTSALLISSISFFLLLSCQNRNNKIDIGKLRFDPENIVLKDSGNVRIDLKKTGISTRFRLDTIEAGLYHLSIYFSAEKPVDVRSLEIKLQYMPDSPTVWSEVKHSFHWVPNLKYDSSDIISRHVFRSPAIILTHQQNALSVIPDLDAMKTYSSIPYYSDLNFTEKGIFISYGLSKYKTKRHVYYAKSDSSFVFSGNIEMGLYVICKDKSTPLDILKKTNTFLWDKYAKQYTGEILPQVLPFSDYASKGYEMGLKKYWIDGPGPGTGGIALSTFLDKKTGIYRGRDYKDDLWFHSWFNNARTAYGLWLWGKNTGNRTWMEKGLSVMNLLLDSPRDHGFFKTIWVPEKNGWISSGQGGGPGLYHLPDNAWTAIWLLRFDEELQHLDRANRFLSDFSEGLMNVQLENGNFPARLNVNDLSPDSVMINSASGAMPTWFLVEMLLHNRLDKGTSEKAKAAVSRSLAFLENEILPQMRFQDYEVFFSCAPNALNRFDSITWMWPHNTLSIQWSAEAFLKAYKLFNNRHYLDQGEYCLNILSLYQQVWNPPYIDFYAFGGFGVQNTDAEWSDARQAQFSETYLNYYFATGKKEYLERSVAACRASFALMALAENREICPQNYMGSTFNGEFTGAMAENFGHSGYNIRSGQSGFHWGTGSALTTASILKEKLGDLYIDGKAHFAVGIDGIVVKRSEWGDTIKLVTGRVNNLNNIKIRSNLSGPSQKKVVLDNGKQVYPVN
jgi:hypothetical protein